MVLRAATLAWLGLAMAASAQSGRESRRDVLFREVLSSGERHYDQQTHLVRDASPDERHDEQTDQATEASGRSNVARGSLEYAVALLKFSRDAAASHRAGDPESQEAGSPLGQRANEILRAVLFAQDGKPGSPTYGNFRWYAEDTRVRQAKAVLYVAPWLAYIAQEYGGRSRRRTGSLDATTHELLWDALPLALHAVREREVDVQQTSAYLLRIASMTYLGRITRRPRDVAAAAEALDEWLAFVGEHGIGEYNSPSAMADSIVALQWVWQAARQESTRVRAEQALYLLYRDVLEHYHAASGMPAGACEEAYEAEYRRGEGPLRYLLWYHLGRPEVRTLEPWALVHAVQTYAPNDGLFGLVGPATYPREVRRHVARRVGRGVDTVTYLAPEFSLGTQSGEGGAGQAPLLFTYRSGQPRASGYLHPVPNPVPLNSVQKGNAAICSFVFREQELSGKGFRGLWGSLGSTDAVSEVLIAGRPWDRESVGLEPHTPICARVSRAYIAMIALEVDTLKVEQSPLTRETPVALRIEDGEVAIGVALRAAKGYAPGAKEPLRAGVAILVESGSRFGSLAEFGAFIAGGDLQETRAGSRHTVSWRCGDIELRLEHDLQTLEIAPEPPG